MKIQDDVGFVSVTDCVIFVCIYTDKLRSHFIFLYKAIPLTGWQFLESLVLFNGSCQMKVIGWLSFFFLHVA